MNQANENLRRCGKELYPLALELSDAKASVSYFEARVIKHALLVTAQGSDLNSTLRTWRMHTLREFCTRLRESRAKQRRCQKALDLKATQLKRRP